MSLLKILILSNVLDPFVPLEAVRDAYRAVEDLERDPRSDDLKWYERLDPREAQVRSVIAASFD